MEKLKKGKSGRLGVYWSFIKNADTNPEGKTIELTGLVKIADIDLITTLWAGWCFGVKNRGEVRVKPSSEIFVETLRDSDTHSIDQPCMA